MVSSTSRPTDASPAAQPLRGGRPIRTFPFGAPAVARRLNATLQAAAADHYRPRPLPARPAPYDRKPLLEELEPRLLLSADLNPLAHDTLLAAPALHGAEFRSLADPGLPAVVTALEVAPIARASEIAFVDPAAPDYQSLIEDMRATALAQGRNLEIVLLDAERDGIRRITDVLAQRQGLDAVHIVSHATDGAVRLGSATLDAAALADRAGAIERWGAALADEGDILFYGCDLAATAQGKALIDAIARLTGADVAASEDPTGHADRGGNWKLEFTTGRIEAQVAVSAAKQASWDAVLAAPVVDLNGPGTFTAADSFAAQSYNGGTNWVGGWRELDTAPSVPGNSDNSPTNGNVQLVAAGGGYEVRFNGHADAPRDFVQREVNLRSYTTATLSFDYRMQSVEAGDSVTVLASSNGGATFTSLGVLPTVTSNTSFTVDISGYISDRTVIRFTTSAGFLETDDRFFLDNVQITATGNNYFATFTEGGSAVPIAGPSATVTDPDGGSFQGATITLTNPQAGDLLAIGGALPGGITGVVSGNTVTLSGASSGANYANALKLITFGNTSSTPSTKMRTISIEATDSAGEVSVPSIAYVRVVSVDTPVVAQPDTFSAPNFGSISGNVLADNGAGADFDADGVAPLTVSTTLVANPTQGTVTLNADGTFTYTPTGAGSYTDTFQYRLISLAQVPGTSYEYWNAPPSSFGSNWGLLTSAGLPNFPFGPPDSTGFLSSYDVDQAALNHSPPNTSLNNFTVRFTSEFEVVTAGTYRFYSASDDGSILYINGTMVVNNDGAHPFQEYNHLNGLAYGEITLAAGRHVIRVDFFEVGGQEELIVSYSGPDTGGVKTDMSGAIGMLAPTYATGTVTINVVASAPRLAIDGTLGSLYALDEFASGGYGGNDGTFNFAGAWTEANDGTGSATGGQIRAGNFTAALPGDELRIQDTNSPFTASVQRTVDLLNPSAGSPTRFASQLSFAYDATNFTAGSVGVQISNDGTTWTTIDTLTPANTTASGTKTYDLRPYGTGAATQVRFLASAANPAVATPPLYIDNVRIDAAPVNRTVTYTEDGPAVAIAGPNAGLLDAGTGNLSRSVITLTNPQAGDLLGIAGTLPGGIVGSVSANVVTLSGLASRAHYLAALGQIVYSTTSDTPATVNRLVQVYVVDAAGVRSNTATATIGVVAVNDSPIAAADTAIVQEDVTLTASGNVLANDTDPEGNPLTVSAIAGGTVGSARAGTYGSVTLNANGSYTYTLNNALASVQALAAGQTLNDVFTYTVSDGNGGSASTTLTVTIQGANDAPVLDTTKSPALAPISEDAGPPSGAVGTLVSSLVDFALPAGQVDNVTDVDAGALLGIAVVGADTTNGAWFFSVNGGSTWSALGAVTTSSARLLEPSARLYFQPNPNWNGSLSAAITFRAWDQSSGSNGALASTTANGGSTAFSAATDTASLVVNAVNDPPVLAGTAGGVTYTENGAAVSLVSGAGVSDVDAANFNGGSVTVSLAVYQAGDVLSINHQGSGAGQIGVAGINVQYGGTTFGTFAGGTAANLVISLNANATPAAVQALMGQLRYASTAEDPTVNGTATTRALTVTLNDGGNTGSGGAQTASLAGTITITPLTDAPVIGGAGSTRTYTENATGVALEPTLTVTDADDTHIASGSVTISAGFTAGDTLTWADQPGIIANYAGGVLTLSGNATLATYQTLLRSVAFSSTSDDPTAASASRTISWSLTDADSDGAGPGTGTATTAVNIIALNDPPTLSATALNPTFTEAAGLGTQAPPVTVFSNALASTVESGQSIVGLTLTVSGLLDGASERILVDGTTLILNGAAAGTTAGNGMAYTVSVAGGVATVTLAKPAGISTAALAALVEGIAYQNTSTDDPTAGGRVVTIAQLRDSGGGADTSAPAIGSTVSVVPVNDPPIAQDDGLTAPATILLGAGGAAWSATPVAGVTVTASSGLPGAGATLHISGNDLGVNSAAPNNRISQIEHRPDGTTESITIDLGTVVTSATFTFSRLFVNEGGAGNHEQGRWVALLDGVEVASGTFVAPADNSGNDTVAITNRVFNQVRFEATPYSQGNTTATDSSDYFLTAFSATTTGYQFITFENDPLTIAAASLLANDADPEGDTLTISSVTAIVGTTLGSVSLVAGQVLYDPGTAFDHLQVGETATDTFEYTVSDGQGGFDTAIVTVLILGTNDTPVANPDSYTVAEDATLTVAAAGVLANDTDVDGDALSAVLVTGPANGSLTLNADGSFTYTPNANFNGTDAFTYRAHDGTVDSALATVTLTVTAVNDTPVANPDSYTVAEDATLTVAAAGVLANDTDVDGDALSAVLVTGPANGSLTLNADGSFTYTPNANFNGTDAFTYRAHDGTVDSALATVTLTVTAVNDTPVANPDSYTVAEDATLTVAAAGVLANDTDVDGDALSAVLVTGPANGSLTLNADGSFTYTPNANFNGTDAFTYRAHDGTVDSALATVTLTVTAVNDTPVANPDSYTVAEDATLTVAAAGVLANDTDVDGDALSAVLVTGPANGSLTLNADGSFTYTPNANFNGTDAFTYRAHDGTVDSALATVTLTVTAVNDTPVANPDSYTVAEDATLTVAAAGVLANDTDVDGDALSAVLVTGPANGSLTLNADGSFTYTPNANFNGTDAFTYRAHDGTVDSALATVTLTVTAVNDTPVANPDSYTVAEDATLTVAAAGVLANDTDVDGDALSAVLVTGPANGSLTLNADGSFTYTPNANFNGTDAFTYRAHDGTVDSALATVTLTVTAVNDTPVANPDSYTVAEDATLTVAAAGVLANDTDVDGDALSAVLVTGPANGSLTLNADGSFTYTPNANFNGTDAFTYRAHDGTVDSALATVTLTVTAVNDTPVANPDSYTVAEDATLTVAAAGVLANDTDVDGDALSAVLVTGPANGSLTLNADGSFTYTPNANFNGTDAFTYRAHDGTVDSALATVTLTVTAVNDTPVANPDSYTVAEDATLTVAAAGVLANDTDVDGDALSAVLVTGPANGSLTLNADGSFTYTPNANFNGTDAFTYRAHDGTVDSALATVTLTVTAVNDPPILTTNAWTIADGGTLTVTLANIGATDPDSPIGPLAFAVGSVTHGFFALAGNPAVAITTFTQQQVIDGLVRFVHDGSGNAPGFTLYVSDGSLGDGPYLGNITFVKAPGGIIGTPFDGSSGGRTGAGGTSSGPAEPPAVPAAFPLLSQVLATARNGLLNPAIQLFVRVPAAGDLDGGSAFAEAPLPGVTLARAEAGAVTLPVLPPGGELAPLQANGDSIATKLQAVMDGIAPIQAEMLAIPTKFGLDLYDPEQRRVEIALDAIRVTGLALSVGAVWWAARAASLVASLLASTPAWRHVDPLPILGRDEEEEARYGWTDPREQDRARQDEERNAARLLEDGPRG